MRIFTIDPHGVHETGDLPTLRIAEVVPPGFIWISCTRSEFESTLEPIQATLAQLTGVQLLDLHISDLLNRQLPSRYDFTSDYDLLVFRRLAASPLGTAAAPPASGEPRIKPLGGPPILRRIDTSPVGFAVFDQVLLTVHPQDCAVRDAYASKLTNAAAVEQRTASNRLATSPADLMLRIVNLMVDGFLELRRELTHQLDHWQTELLDPKTRFNNWGSMLQARLALHQLDEICEDQHTAIQDWIEAVKTWPEHSAAASQRERDLLQVRSRDVLEHIERVVHHVRRLEQSAEAAIQMHFSAQTHRTNEIMRTLTVLTAVFLPLNLIAGIFGMNFEFIPLIHRSGGFWWAMGGMGFTALALLLVFWRKRYLARASR
ncbi:magnesium transporter CorA family protein [Rhodoferax sp.]|uniref:magnesium transporter CorA family protein n=1 Tax=Rhodoferax sp. TaxID=50421 RepID=UPI00274368D8|nr:magnesium transporter CorA family protein [Rhodoferax sp.]